MNYKRIYDEFIQDRKKKPPERGSYFEVHHIIPQCMGGLDLKTNLIKLSATDHLFAHQLLARAYDKTKHSSQLWGAVLILCKGMMQGKRKGMLAVTGKQIAGLRRSMDRYKKERIERFSGANAPNIDKNIYNFVNINGDNFVGIRYEFAKKYGVSVESTARLVERETNRNLSGWSILRDDITPEERKKRATPGRLVFVHVNGAVYKGTRDNFKYYTGMSWSMVHAIVDHFGASPSGWMMRNRDGT